MTTGRFLSLEDEEATIRQDISPLVFLDFAFTFHTLATQDC